MGIQNKIIQILIAVVGLFLALWLVMSSVTLPEYYQVSLLISSLVIGAILLIRRDLPFDFKVLGILLAGYAFAGKGFAYITPFEPVYIGEITMIICMLGLILRWTQGADFLPTHLHWLLLGWMVTVGLYLAYSFDDYRMMAIRDSAMGYYAAFFFTSFAIFRNPKASEAFSVLMKVCVGFGILSSIVLTLVWEKLAEASPLVARFFMPHADAFIPLIVAGTVYGLMQGMIRRSLPLLAVGAVALFLLMINKTAGIFSFVVVLSVLIVFARRMELLFTSLIGLTFGAVVIAIMLAAGSSFMEEKIYESDQLQTLRDMGETTGKSNANTTEWRVSWWTIIVEDTLEENPFTGVGMGGDISGHFMESILGISQSSLTTENFARYPHNIIFTVIGRMGFLGLGIFLIPFVAMILFGIRFCSQNLKTPEEQRHYLIPLVIFFAGLSNSLVQSTYEVPYGAIMHWSCLGYLAAYRYRESAKVSKNTSVPEPQKRHETLAVNTVS